MQRELEGFAELPGGGNPARLVEKVVENVQHFTRNVSTLERQVKRYAGNENSELLDSIPQLEKDTVQLATFTKTSMQKAGSRMSELDADSRMRFDRVRNNFSTSLAKFQKLQQTVKDIKSEAMNKTKSSAQRGSFTSGGGFGEDDLTTNLLTSRQAQAMDLDQDAYLVEERQREMQHLETDILEINNIFRDLGTMVYEQGETIDSIEANVEQGADRVVSGNKQLVKAIKHQRTSRRLCCCIWCILITVAIVIVIVILVALRVAGVIGGKK